MKKSLIIGAAMLDIVMQIDELPKKGEDVYACSQEMTVGGCAYNVADILKRFSVPYTLFAPVGNGFYAGFIPSFIPDFVSGFIPGFIQSFILSFIQSFIP